MTDEPHELLTLSFMVHAKEPELRAMEIVSEALERLQLSNDAKLRVLAWATDRVENEGEPEEE